MKNIAIITSGDPNNMKGIMNYVQEKLHRIQKYEQFSFTFYMIRHRDSLLFSLIRRRKREKQDETITIDDVTYHNIWVKHSFWGYIRVKELKKDAFFDRKEVEKHVNLFAKYDLIVTHNLDSSDIGMLVKRKYKIPFVITWHGGDTYLWPFINKDRFLLTKSVMESADMNYFVSKSLMKKSDEITTNAKKDYIYTGPADFFYKYSDEQKVQVRKKYDVLDKKVVAFAGNLVTIKNIKVLPNIFEQVAKIKRNVVFWIIGDGFLRKNLCDELNILHINYRMFGNIAPKNMPDLMNCIDVLILPSLNEGTPLVVLEAITCGANVVGSNVGGIPEVIGNENVFNLDDNFVQDIGRRITQIIENNEHPKTLSKEFSWNSAIEKEINKYSEILKEE